MWITEEAASAAEAGGVRPIMLLRIDGSPVARAWSGVGDLRIAQDAVETEDNARYFGVGAMLDWPPLEVLLNGEAARIVLSLSGVDAQARALFEREMADLDGAQANLGIGFLDERFQPVAAPLWLVEAQVEDASTFEEVSGSGKLRTIETSLAHGSLDRRRPIYSHWSPQDQENRSPGDLFCSRTPKYNQGVTVTWPRF